MFLQRKNVHCHLIGWPNVWKSDIWSIIRDTIQPTIWRPALKWLAIAIQLILCLLYFFNSNEKLEQSFVDFVVNCSFRAIRNAFEWNFIHLFNDTHTHTHKLILFVHWRILLSIHCVIDYCAVMLPKTHFHKNRFSISNGFWFLFQMNLNICVIFLFVRSLCLVRINLNFIQFHFSFSFRSTIAIATGITQAQKYEILEAHNRLRSQVAQGRVSGQPGAQNMREMVWDDELAARAQQWANQCIFEHDPSRYTGKKSVMNFGLPWHFALTCARHRIRLASSMQCVRHRSETRNENENKSNTFKIQILFVFTQIVLQWAKTWQSFGVQHHWHPMMQHTHRVFRIGSMKCANTHGDQAGHQKPAITHKYVHKHHRLTHLIGTKRKRNQIYNLRF